MKFTLLFSIYSAKMLIIKLSGICGLNVVMALECRLIQFREIHLSVNGSKVIKLNTVNEQLNVCLSNRELSKSNRAIGFLTLLLLLLWWHLFFFALS